MNKHPLLAGSVHGQARPLPYRLSSMDPRKLIPNTCTCVRTTMTPSCPFGMHFQKFRAVGLRRACARQHSMPADVLHKTPPTKKIPPRLLTPSKKKTRPPSQFLQGLVAIYRFGPLLSTDLASRQPVITLGAHVSQPNLRHMLNSVGGKHLLRKVEPRP